MSGRRVLVLTVGNPGRQDDGIGFEACERLLALGLDGVTVETDFQLNIEHAAALAGHDAVLLIDASRDGPEPYALEQVRPAASIAFTSHTLGAPALLAMCEEHFGGAPETWMLGVRGYEWEFAEGLSAGALDNLEQAITHARSLIAAWKETDT